MLNKIDAILIRAFEESYLWFFDRTGTYIGTLINVTAALGIGVDVFSHNWIGVGLIGTTGLISGPLHWALQHFRPEDEYNKIVLAAREYRVGPFVRLMLVLTFVFSLPMAHIAWSMLPWTILNYLPCVMIRKRDPRGFFEFKPDPVPDPV